jgi:protein TonB
MKRDIVVSAIIAVGVHAFILSATVPDGGSVRGTVYEPITLSILYPPKEVGEPPPVEKASEPVSRPDLSPRQKPMPKETVAAKKKLPNKKGLTAKGPVKEKKVGVERIEDVTKQTLMTPEPVEHLPENSVGAVNENAVKEGPHSTDGEAENPSALQRASIQKYDGHDALQKGGTAPAKGSAEGMTTYAMPKYKEGARPVYPKVAERRGYEGTVRLEVEILETGEVGEVKILESSGFEVLDKEAVRWVHTNPFVHGPNNEKRTYLVPVVFIGEEKEKVLAREKRK